MPTTVIPGRAFLARTRNPWSAPWLWIPGPLTSFAPRN